MYLSSQVNLFRKNIWKFKFCPKLTILWKTLENAKLFLFFLLPLFPPKIQVFAKVPLWKKHLKNSSFFFYIFSPPSLELENSSFNFILFYLLLLFFLISSPYGVNHFGSLPVLPCRAWPSRTACSSTGLSHQILLDIMKQLNYTMRVIRGVWVSREYQEIM